MVKMGDGCRAGDGDGLMRACGRGEAGGSEVDAPGEVVKSCERAGAVALSGSANRTPSGEAAVMPLDAAYAGLTVEAADARTGAISGEESVVSSGALAVALSAAAVAAAARREAKEANAEGAAAKGEAIGLLAVGSPLFEREARGLVLIARMCALVGVGSNVLPDGASVCSMCCGCSCGALARGEIWLSDEEVLHGDVGLRGGSDARRARWRWLKVAKRRRVAAALWSWSRAGAAWSEVMKAARALSVRPWHSATCIIER